MTLHARKFLYNNILTINEIRRDFESENLIIWFKNSAGDEKRILLSFYEKEEAIFYINLVSELIDDLFII